MKQSESFLCCIEAVKPEGLVLGCSLEYYLTVHLKGYTDLIKSGRTRHSHTGAWDNMRIVGIKS